MNDDHDITHSFSRIQAKQYGVNAALVLGYLGYKIARSQNIKDGKRWHYDTFESLTQHYPYLSKTAIYNAVQALIIDGGPVITGNYNKWKQDKTTWYAFRDERTIQQLQAEPIYFKAHHAQSYGICESVLMTNIAYWIEENRKKDAGYQFHPVSPLKLKDHLPFSRNTIQRALDNLVQQQVLMSRKLEDSRRPTEYAFVQELGEETGCPNLNLTCPTENIAGPILNLTCPTENIDGPTENDITILVDNHLEEPCLKEACLKENHFKASPSFFSSNTCPDLTKSKPDSDPKPVPVQNEGHNHLFEPIVHPVQDETGLARQNPLSDQTPSPSPDSDTKLVPAPDAQSNAKHPLVPAPPLSEFQTSQLPEIRFLDPVIHDSCWSVMKLHYENPDPTYENMAEAIIYVSHMLIDQTSPQKLHELALIDNQAQLNAALLVWSSAFFTEFYDTKMAIPELHNNNEFRQMFLNHAHCFLNMAFHGVRFAERTVYKGLHYYHISLRTSGKINTWLEKRDEANRVKDIKRRAVQFASQDQHKENDPNLSPAEKMQVFSQSLQARNRIGRYDEWGKFSEDVVLLQTHSLNLVRQFFQLNPALTPAHLNLILDECLKLDRTIDGLDPVWYAKNGYKISFLLKNLATVAGQVNGLSKLPAFVPLPVKEEEE